MDRRHAASIAEVSDFLKKGEVDSAQAALKPVLLENPRHGQAILLQRKLDEVAAKLLLTEPALQGKFRSR
jgi:general secretion pathway protein D